MKHDQQHYLILFFDARRTWYVKFLYLILYFDARRTWYVKILYLVLFFDDRRTWPQNFSIACYFFILDELGRKFYCMLFFYAIISNRYYSPWILRKLVITLPKHFKSHGQAYGRGCFSFP